MPTHRQEPPDPLPGRREKTRRPGSRFLLAAALVGVVVSAFVIGARLADILCDILGVASTPARLGVKVASITVALPALFYLVERFFLSRSSKGKGRS